MLKEQGVLDVVDDRVVASVPRNAEDDVDGRSGGKVECDLLFMRAEGKVAEQDRVDGPCRQGRPIDGGGKAGDREFLDRR